MHDQIAIEFLPAEHVPGRFPEDLQVCAGILASARAKKDQSLIDEIVPWMDYLKVKRELERALYKHPNLTENQKAKLRGILS